MNAPATIDVTTRDWTCFAVTIEDKVAHIQLKRPEAMNSMIRDFWNELIGAEAFALSPSPSQGPAIDRPGTSAETRYSVDSVGPVPPGASDETT